MKERFLNKVEKTDSCWLWNAAKRGNGYGAFKHLGKVHSSHRISYIIFKGEIPEELVVCHTCDNRLCVNPEHLFLGTMSDNMQDCIKKGRFVINENRPKFVKGQKALNRALSTEKVLEIKEALKNKNNKSITQLAKELNVKRHLITDIAIGKTYKDN